MSFLVDTDTCSAHLKGNALVTREAISIRKTIYESF
jgi:hypothetical protein